MATATLPVGRIVELSRDRGFQHVLGRLYRAVDAVVARHNPVCINRGLCCNFDAFDHRLFVTPVELAFYVAMLEQVDRPENGSCPYQRHGLCTTRPARPVGCRVFFCDPNAASWQAGLTERVLRRLKRLHGRFDIPYAYVEWLDALRQLSDWRADQGGSV